MIPTIQINVRSALAAAGYKFSGGQWLRLKGKGLDAISVNAESGGWIDHRSGEHGPFSKLGEILPGLPVQNHEDKPKYRPAARRNWKKRQENQDAWKKSQAQGQWKNGIPAWSQPEWGKEQEQYQDCRDAIYDYLLSRGLDPDPLLPLIKFSTHFNPEKSTVDKEMQENGADFWFMVPMFEIGKSQDNQGNICGIQRTFLKFGEDKYQQVKKIGRAMLGKKGVTEIRPGENESPVILPTLHPILAAGEGFETVASFVQSMKRVGVVCWDWSGLKKWSQQITMQPDSATVAFLVDRDTSQTGQRESAAACCRILTQEYGHDSDGNPKAIYLLPPDMIRPDPKGNRDWNDLLKQYDAEVFAAEIVKAWHNQAENMKLAPTSNDLDHDQVDLSQYKGPKNADVKQVIANAVELHFAFEQVKEKTEQYEKDFANFNKKIADWSDQKADFEQAMKAYKALPKSQRRGAQKPEKLPRPKLPPLLVKVTTGVGKSHQIRELIKNSRVPILILTRTHDLANEYEQVGAFHYHGRSDVPYKIAERIKYVFNTKNVSEIGHLLDESTCFKYPVIELVAENNHIPALTACRNCEHGQKFMIENYDYKSQPYQDAKQWFMRNDVDENDVPACFWLSHQMHASHERVVVAPNASFSDTLAHFYDADGEIKPRLVIVDEIPDLMREIEVDSKTLAEAISQAKQSNALMQEILKNAKAYQKPDSEIESIEKIIADLNDAVSIFGEIGDWIGQSVKHEAMQKLPKSLATRMKDLHVDWLPGATARWEKAEIRYGKEPFVPLRMTKAIIESVATRTQTLQKGVLHVREVTALGEYIKAGKSSILLDATPNRAVEYLVAAKGGETVRAIAKQHIKLIHYNQYLHGRTWKNKDHQKSELTRLLTLKEIMTGEVQATPAVLTYMPHCELAEKTNDDDWGYFGRDDIGQDNWKGRHLLIFGGPLFSPITQAKAYNSELMLMRLAGAEGLPDWDEAVERNQEITVGSKLVQSKAPLPTDPYLRDWVLADYGRRIVQGIGRVRGVRASAENPLNVWVVGGLPLAGLADHGLEVNEYRQESHLNLRDESHKEAQQKVEVAIAALQAADQDTSYRQVNRWLVKHDLPEVRYDAWKKAVNKLSTGLNKDSYGPVDGLLSSLFAIKEAADLSGCDISDMAQNVLSVENDDVDMQIAAEIILEVSPHARKWREKRE